MNVVNAAGRLSAGWGGVSVGRPVSPSEDAFFEGPQLG